MKVCTYKRSTALGTFSRMGVFFNEETLLDTNLVMQAYYEKEGFYDPKTRAEARCPASVSAFLKSSDHALESLNNVVNIYLNLSQQGITQTLDGASLVIEFKKEAGIKLAAPLDHMTSYRDFYAHEKHVKKGFEKRNEPVPPAWYEIPAFYKGATTGFIGQDDIIMWPYYTQQLDYELELGLVIGRDGKNIKAKDAHKYIFGYTILNDISARDIQRKEMSIRLGPAKGKDFCSIMGPVIVTADEFKFQEPNLLMTASVNGQEWSRGMSGDSHYTWAEIIEHTSMEEWIRTTDFLGSGTVGTGCGLELDKWIKPGDVLELTIDQIGTLKNKVGQPNTKI